MTQDFITRAGPRWRLGALILLLVSLLVGCSAARLGYSHGETLSYWWLDRYVGFEDEQKAKIRADLATLFAWHRTTQLPAYIEQLSLAQQAIDETVSVNTIHARRDALRQHLMALAEQALPQLADLALALQGHQIDNIERKFASNNDDYRKDHLRGDLEDRQRTRFKQTMKHAEYWFGPFSDEQERQIRLASDARRALDTAMAERMRRQKALLTLLKKIQSEKPDRQNTVLLLRQHLAAMTAEQVDDEREQRWLLQSKEATAQLVSVIFSLVSAEQKQHFLHVTQQWKTDFLALSKR